MVMVTLFAAGCSDQDMGSAKKTSAATFTSSNPYKGELSGVTLNVGSSSSDLAQAIVKAAGLDNTPYTVNYHNLRGGNLVLEAMAAGTTRCWLRQSDTAYFCFSQPKRRQF
jgi:sulfonate transport system substrate-binding protein